MQYIYAACAFAVLVRLRGSPFVFFRIFLVASIVSRLCWRPTLDAAWWKWWLIISEPLVLTLTLVALIECGHLATIRCFPSARRSLLAMSLLFGSVGFVFTFWMEDTGNAAIGVWSKFIVDDPYHWWMASAVSWAVSSVCMVHWCFIALPIASRDFSGVQSQC